MAQFV